MRLLENDSRSEVMQIDRSSLAEGVRDGQKALIGIRPECVRVVEANAPLAAGNAAVDGVVTAMENTGSDLIATITFGGGSIVARLRQGEAQINAPIRLAFDTKDALVFDAATERRLNIVKEYAA